MFPIPPLSILPLLFASIQYSAARLRDVAGEPDAPWRRLDDLPGPGAWALMAHLLRGRAARIHRLMEGWSRRYDSLFSARLGTRRELVVADHETIVAATTSSGTASTLPDGR